VESNPLKILFVSVEVSPFAKVGGLADVAGSLPSQLAALGHDVRVVCPRYRIIEEDSRFELKPASGPFNVRLNKNWNVQATVETTVHDGVEHWFIDGDEFFASATSSATIYQNGVEKYLFFSEAVLAATQAMHWTPDIIHANDWHTGLIPLLMRARHGRSWENTVSVFTIHNFAYQGEFGPEILDMLELSRAHFNHHETEAYGALNFLKTGCVFADMATTVSPRYAQEIQTPEFGNRLEGLMRHLSEEDRLAGILNGIDQREFNPAADPRLAKAFDAANPAGKADCKHALRERLGLAEGDKPIIGVVSRLSHQKGLDVLASSAKHLVEMGFQLVVQGLGDSNLVDAWRALAAANPDDIGFVEAFDETMAMSVYAGSDFFAMPSRFEPCGLGQMIALRYGTLPIVRRTGGLADTIREGKNGFVFQQAEPVDLINACQRALEVYRSPEWPEFVVKALSEDFGWTESAKQYSALYQRMLNQRREAICA
jgi:starch synthase